ncbi:Dienelactone hydrolase [Sphingobium herbicidovorans NBRC 16415]|uniref:Dienelactone hydrolase n=1 Tax=Sphingobium herbicidovorans (strain ATCC 700291 / DSM 11019 / CCUG 56400 / KCTC 2939 / LMG 18315 / NBRC 16415 / MH) TaxID=1219045 RepID=A0A086PC30_SPHHM|nr:dienelactone hydrolase family protein [Sphingobium herbicidovorans]KFG90948.1 Dienelactone hydrolase [Sphingobium herbicidovorans NBRC 16415]
MAIKTEILSYEADGLTMISHFFVEESVAGLRPGVLVFPEAFGLGDHAKARAEQLAALGYAALACDLHGSGRVISSVEEVMGILGPMRQDLTRTRARARGGLDALLTRPEVNGSKVAAIGFCFGGTMALELARSGADLAAAVGFHSGLATVAAQDAKNIVGKVLVCIGADDPGVPPEERAGFEKEMREGGVDWRMHLYGKVVHSFTNRNADELGQPELARYDASADARSWLEMLALFDEVFGRTPVA